MSSDLVIDVNDVSKTYLIYDKPENRLKQMVVPRLRSVAGLSPVQYFREFPAVRHTSFQVGRGETVGIVGRNGSGKSTLLEMICGTLQPTGGTINVHGRIAALLELGSGFNPDFTGRENVYLNAAGKGYSLFNAVIASSMLILGFVILVASLKRWAVLWKARGESSAIPPAMLSQAV